jgi:hypothetical protein
MTANNMAIFEASTVDRDFCDKARQRLAITGSIVMPCLNEAETLEFCIIEAQSTLLEAGIDGEVVSSL